MAVIKPPRIIRGGSMQPNSSPLGSTLDQAQSKQDSAKLGLVPSTPQLELQHGDCGVEHGTTFVKSSTTLKTDIPDFLEPQLFFTVSL